MNEKKFTTIDEAQTLLLEVNIDTNPLSIEGAVKTLHGMLNDLEINANDYTNKGQNEKDRQELLKILKESTRVQKNSLSFDKDKLKTNLQKFKEKIDDENKNLKSRHGNQENLDYLGLKEKGLKLKEHELRDTDINHALNHLLDIDPKTKKSRQFNDKNIYVTAGMEINQFDQSFAITLFGSETNSGVEYPCTIYVPLNLGNYHWVSLKIEVTKNGDYSDAKITCVDSMGGISQKNIDIIKNTLSPFFGKTTIKSDSTKKQSDFWRCGYYTIGEIATDAGLKHPIVTAYDKNDENGKNQLVAKVFSAIEAEGIKTRLILPSTSKENQKEIIKALKSVCEDNRATIKEEKDKTVITTEGEEEITCKKGNEGYEVSTDSDNQKTLELMILAAKKVLETLKTSQHIEIETVDKKTQETLEKICTKHNIKAIFPNSKTTGNLDTTEAEKQERREWIAENLSEGTGAVKSEKSESNPFASFSH